MGKSALSVFVFGLYYLLLGIILVVVPNFLLRLFSIPNTDEVWIHVVGVLVLILSFYAIQSARKEMTEFFKLTVYSRAPVILFFTAFVLLGFTPPVLILFGAIDLLGAIWTAWALRIAKVAPKIT